MSTIGKTIFVPSDVLDQICYHVLKGAKSLDDAKSLVRFQRVSKNFYLAAGNDVFWQTLLKNICGIDVSNGKGKEAWNVPILRNRNDLFNTVEAFQCRLELWKTRRLECLVPSHPPMSLEVSFGPPSDLKADQTHRYLFLGNVEELRKVQHSSCESSAFLANKPNYPYHEKSRSCFQLFRNCMLQAPIIEIKEVDIGNDHTLAYYSSIDNWKELFKLFPVSGDNGRPVMWAGRIPLHAEFKFVKIAPNGDFTWENHAGNRVHPNKNWSAYFKEQPVSFSLSQVRPRELT